MQRAIQSSFMVYKWTMAMQFSFEYCIVPKVHKSEEEINAIQIEGAMWPKLQPDAMQDGGVPSKHWNVAALFVRMPAHYLIMEICDWYKYT